MVGVRIFINSLLPHGGQDKSTSRMNKSEDIPFEFTWRNAAFTMLAFALCLTTTLANIILIVLVCVDKALRRYNNYYVVSLAMADLVVGVFVAPMFSLYTILGEWPLGEIVCELWIFVDFTCVSASMLGLCLISLDRYWAITQPLRHLRRQGRRRALASIAVVWVISALCWIPAMATWKAVEGSFAKDSECLYLPSFTYVMISTVVVYGVPMVSLVVLYGRIYYTVRNKMLQAGHTMNVSTPGLEENPTDNTKLRCCCCIDKGFDGEDATIDKSESSITTISQGIDLSMTTAIGSIGVAVTTLGAHSSTSDLTQTKNSLARRSNPTDFAQVNNCLSVDLDTDQKQSLPPKATVADLTPRTSTYAAGLQTSRQLRERLSRLRLQQRTSKTLGIIIVVFLICWIPFIVLFPLNSYCSCVPIEVYDMSYWLAYINSAMNPFLYGFNSDFRRAFRRTICPNAKVLNNNISTKKGGILEHNSLR
ncbi:probable G-protein coupled receptor No18 [Diadema antillarum]|uniref:probable G-protein coupled receptor No18 n=1 Tax=Diadema antillarum TaxID=105358 RepID=UPI003A839C9A